MALEQDVNTQKPSPDTPMNHVMNFDKNTDLNIKRCVDETEKKIIKEAIDRCDGNKTEAAKLLGSTGRPYIRKSINSDWIYKI